MLSIYYLRGAQVAAEQQPRTLAAEVRTSEGFLLKVSARELC